MEGPREAKRVEGLADDGKSLGTQSKGQQQAPAALRKGHSGLK
jgi:hypothetical protein